MSGGGIGIIGAPKTGVSSVAFEVCNLIKLPLLICNTQTFFDILNINRFTCSFSEKLFVYKTCLDAMENNYLFCDGLFVAEIIPMQLAAEIVIEAGKGGLSPYESAAVTDFVIRCETVCNLYFRSIVLVQPGIVCEGAEAEKQANINLVLSGMLTDANKRLYMQKSILNQTLLDNKQRAATVIKLAALDESQLMQQRKNSVVH
jgi:hypothetical protein